jgi:hypothetical protein
MVEYLSSKHEALNSNPNTAKINKLNKNLKTEFERLKLRVGEESDQRGVW